MIEVLTNSGLQLVLLLLVAPLLSGMIKTLKARLQTRRGPGVLQSYRDIFKLLRKGMVIPETASWIFSAAPYMVFCTATLVGLMIPMTTTHAPLSLFGGVLAVVGLLALGRFFLALGGLDTGSSFGGLGSSREMTISAIAEPAMMLAIFTVALGANSTNLSEMAKCPQNKADANISLGLVEFRIKQCKVVATSMIEHPHLFQVVTFRKHAHVSVCFNDFTYENRVVARCKFAFHFAFKVTYAFADCWCFDFFRWHRC